MLIGISMDSMSTTDEVANDIAYSFREGLPWFATSVVKTVAPPCFAVHGGDDPMAKTPSIRTEMMSCTVRLRASRFFFSCLKGRR